MVRGAANSPTSTAPGVATLCEVDLYGFTTTLTGLSFDEALTKTTAALKAEGFGVLSDLDIQRALKEKLGADMIRRVVLGLYATARHGAAWKEPSETDLVMFTVAAGRQQQRHDGRVGDRANGLSGSRLRADGARPGPSRGWHP
jgi:hypothetical protein